MPSSAKLKVEGTAEDGFEPVKALFEKQLKEGRGENAQVCVYVGGKKVVDLYGTNVGDSKYDGDSLHTVFSSTKSVAAITFACLVDKGLIDYDERVSKYWPEFAQNGKEEVTVAQVLRHEAGLAKWKGKISREDTYTENIKKNAIGKVLEEEPLKFPDKKFGTTREYHGMTRGYILNEIFRRVEPSGRTIGEYLRDEIAKPLDIDVHIGAPDDGKRVHDLSARGNGDVMFRSMLPGFLDKSVEVSMADMIKVFRLMKEFGGSPDDEHKMIPYDTEAAGGIIGDSNNYHLRRGETPSAYGSCSARGLAKLAACIVAGGEIDGVRIMSKEGCDKMQADPLSRKDAMIMGAHTCFTQGGVNVFKVNPEDNAVVQSLNIPRENFVGWHGFGGSVFQWHPEHNIGFGFVPTQLAWYDFANKRGAELQQAVVNCVKNLKKA